MVECPQHVAEVGYHRRRFDVDKSVAMDERLAGIDRMIANEVLATFVAPKVGDDVAVDLHGRPTPTGRTRHAQAVGPAAARIADEGGAVTRPLIRAVPDTAFEDGYERGRRTRRASPRRTDTMRAGFSKPAIRRSAAA